MTMWRIRQRQRRLVLLKLARIFNEENEYSFECFDDVLFERLFSTFQVILCTGKHYYTLRKHIDENLPQQRDQIALIRLEQLCPFPVHDIQQALAAYPAVKGITTFFCCVYRQRLDTFQTSYGPKRSLVMLAPGHLLLHDCAIYAALRFVFECFSVR